MCLVFVLQGKARDWATGVFKNIYVENYQDDEEAVGDFFQEKVTIGLYTLHCIILLRNLDFEQCLRSIKTKMRTLIEKNYLEHF